MMLNKTVVTSIFTYWLAHSVNGACYMLDILLNGFIQA